MGENGGTIGRDASQQNVPSQTSGTAVGRSGTCGEKTKDCQKVNQSDKRDDRGMGSRPAAQIPPSASLGCGGVGRKGRRGYPASQNDASDVREVDARRAKDVLDYRRRVPPTHFKIDEAGQIALQIDYPGGLSKAGDLALMSALGTREIDVLNGIVLQLGRLGIQGPTGGADTMDFLLSMVKGIEPRDQVEGMLAAQMAATHLLSMHMASRILAAQTVEMRESAERTFNRLCRTSTTQVETLKRYRTGGEQKVTVQHQHVNVSDGGQAVVGNVVKAGGGKKK